MKELQIEHRRFEILNDGESVSDGDIATLESRIGVRLPAQLRSYYLRWNGGLPYPLDIHDDESVWIRLRWKEGCEAASVGAATNFGGLLLINAKPELDFFRTWTDFHHRVPSDCVGFGRDSGGSVFLIGTHTHNLGRIYFWERSYEADIDAGELPGYDNIADVADSFHDFLLALRAEPRTGETLGAWVKRAYPE